MAGAGSPESGPTLRPEDAGALNRDLQRSLLPRNVPDVKGYDLAAGTTLEKGGRGNTVWDAFELPGAAVTLATLDVRTDGFPPSHFLAMARMMLRESARGEGSLDVLLRRVNEALVEGAHRGTGQFVECSLLVLEPGRVRWASSGRPPGGLIKREGTFDELPSFGPPLGMLPGFRYGEGEVELGPGDAVVVLSHGTPGLLRGAADLVASLHGKPAGELVETLHRAIRKASPDSTDETSALYVRRH